MLGIDLFRKIPAVILSELVEFLEETYILEGESLATQGYFCIIVKGVLQSEENRKIYKSLSSKDIIHDMFSTNRTSEQNNWIATQDCIVYRFDEELFLNLINTHSFIFHTFLRKIKRENIAISL